MEIGSIFEADPGAVSWYAKEMPQTENGPGLCLREVEKYQKRHIRYTASGREAVALALRSIVKNHAGRRIRRCCLLPAYMCESVFLPFRQEGWKIYFYHINRQLEADWEELRVLAAAYEPGIIFLHAYYGADTWAAGRYLLQAWREQGVLIMEDVTQSYYLSCAGRDADYVVGSLRKWYPVPDGGFVAADHELAEEEICTNESFAEKKLEIMVRKWEYLHTRTQPSAKNSYLQMNRELETELDSFAQIRAMSELSAAILSDTDEERCRKRRADNSRLLMHGITWTGQICPVRSAVCKPGCKEDQAPLYFAVYVQDRERLQKYLAEHGIYAPVLWPVGKENQDCLREEENYIYRHLLALPVDQRYGEREMRHIADTINGYAAICRNRDMEDKGSALYTDRYE